MDPVHYDDETPLTKAVLDSNKDALISLLRDSCNSINNTNKLGRTPILLAARDGKLSMVTELTRHGANINKFDNFGNTPLHMAAIHNHVEVINELIDTGADINARNNYGHTPLYLATHSLSLRAANVFLQRGCDPNIRCNTLGTPLMNFAVHSLKSDIYKGVQVSEVITCINNLLLHGALIDEQDKKGNTALHYAIQTQNIYLVIYHLHHGADATLINQSGLTPFTLAIDEQQYEAAFYMSLYFPVRSLIGSNSANCSTATNTAESMFLKLSSVSDNSEQDARDSLCSGLSDIVDYSKLCKLTTGNDDGSQQDTPTFNLSKIQSLQQMCRSFILETLRIAPVSAMSLLPVAEKVKQFLLYGYKPDINPFDVVNIHIACIESDKEEYDPLPQIFEKTNILAVPLAGTTVIEKAVLYGRHRLVRDILDSNPDVCLESNVFHLACETANESMVNLFLSKNPDVNSADENGDIPIYVAARHGQWNIVQLLINKTRDIGQKDKYGKHMIHYACASGDYETVSMLLTCMPNLKNIEDRHGYTPLHLAASCGFLYLKRNIPLPSMFNSDIAMNALILKLMHSVDKRNVSCAMYKEKVRHIDVVRMLISNGSDVNMESDEGSPRVIALSFGHDDIADEFAHA